MNQLITKLSKPSKVASTLDWKKVHGSTVLTLNFHRNRLGIAVAPHPSTGKPVTELEPLKFAKNQIAIDTDCLERFSNIIDDYKVCGVVVSWPLQHDTGRMGAACGRVIYALEQLWQQANEDRHNVLSRPFCLWDSDHVVPKQRQDPAKRVDAFGRCASYGTEKAEEEEEITTDEEDENADSSLPLSRRHKRQDYFASKERYHEDEMTVVVGVWNDFCKEHWPELYSTSFAEPDERDVKKYAPSKQWKMAGESNENRDEVIETASDATNTSTDAAYGT
jgi:RNase H-fold protein (predicted Holliday junction resolvase)